jgi:MFS family permease
MTRASGQAYGWVIVGVGALSTCIGMGALFSLAVFLQPISADTGWSRTAISTALTIAFLAMAAASFLWGALSDRFGPRLVVVCGSLLLGLGLVLASQATAAIEFQVLFGLFVGAAAGAFYAPMMALASSWFDKNRSLAVALVSAGGGTAPVTVAPFARFLIDAYDWRAAMLIVGLVATALLLPAGLLTRRAPAVLPLGSSNRSSPGAANLGAPLASPAPGVVTPAATLLAVPRMTVAEALRTPQFAALALAHFACCAAHSGPIFHMVSYAIGCGVPAMAAVSVYSLAGLSGLGGRLLLGVSADRLGAKPVLVAGLMVQAIGAGAWVFARDLGELYALSAVFGMAYGGVMPLYAILARDFFGPRILGTVFGAIAALANLGMALGPWAGGLVYDTQASYAWLYIGSFAVGLAAVAVALAFKPRPAGLQLAAAE